MCSSVLFNRTNNEINIDGVNITSKTSSEKWVTVGSKCEVLTLQKRLDFHIMYASDRDEVLEPTTGQASCPEDPEAGPSDELENKPYDPTSNNRSEDNEEEDGHTDDELLEELPDLDLNAEEAEPDGRDDAVDEDFDFSRQDLGPRTGERRVSFPTPDKLAVYQEPKEDDFNLREILTPEELLEKYKTSCQKNKTVQLENIVEQLREVRLNINRSAILKLNMNITVEVSETLEDLFKITNFQKIILNHCTFSDGTAFEFINMIEYYEPTTELEVTTDFSDYDLWKAFCSMIRRSQHLETVIFTNMNIDEMYTRQLIFSLNNNPKVINLQFKACTLAKAPSFYLVEPLLMNNTLRELHLNQIGLFTREADSISKLLSRNSYLKVLNLSNNSIGDRGFEVLARGLFTRTSDMGVCTLVVCNNQITERSAQTVASIIRDNKNLRLMNLGYNPLTDKILEAIEPVLSGDTVLEALGLQATLITDTGAQSLGMGLEENTSLRRLNLKCNKGIQIEGLEALCNALTRCKVTAVDIDETNRTCYEQSRYDELVRQLKGLCSVNEKNCKGHVPSCISEKIARRMTLECDPCQSSQPPYLATACPGQPNVQLGRPSSSRFQVSRVRDTVSPSQRFNVVRSSLPLESSILSSSAMHVQEETISRFQSLRSSISSSTDSIESLSTHGIDDSVLSPIGGAATD